MLLKGINSLPTFLAQADVVKGKRQLEEEEATEDIPSFSINEGILYMKTMDGEIDTIYLSSGSTHYRVDILEGLEEKNQYIDVPYLIPISLQQIEEGKYELYYGKQGEYFMIQDIFSFTNMKTV